MSTGVVLWAYPICVFQLMISRCCVYYYCVDHTVTDLGKNLTCKAKAEFCVQIIMVNLSHFPNRLSRYWIYTPLQTSLKSVFLSHSFERFKQHYRSVLNRRNRWEYNIVLYYSCSSTVSFVCWLVALRCSACGSKMYDTSEVVWGLCLVVGKLLIVLYVGKLEGTRPPGRPRCRSKDNIKLGLKK